MKKQIKIITITNKLCRITFFSQFYQSSSSYVKKLVSKNDDFLNYLKHK